MIIGIEGAIGSGKTIVMVRYLHKDKFDLGNRVLTNFKTSFSEPLNVVDILDLENNKNSLNNVSVGIDEITVFMDCRRSSSKMSVLISYFILQTRKRNVQMYYTTQDLSMVDVRLFRHTDIVVQADHIYNEANESIEGWRKYVIMDFRNRKKPTVRRFKLNISNYYGLYDTNEVILPPI